MISSVLLVTSELAPITAGGAGVLLSSLTQRLERAGVSVRTLLVADVEADHPDVQVVPIGQPADAFGFWDRSRLVAGAIAQSVAANRPDLVEIHDFDAIGFDALTRRSQLGLENVPIAVRFHGPVDLQVEATGVVPPELVPVRAMERAVYGMADLVIVPSSGIGRLVVDRYGVAPERLAVGAPPLAPLPRTTPGPTPQRELIVVGRLGEVKGSHDLVRAAVPILHDHPEFTLRFIGGDGWSVTTDQSMRAWLASMIPPALESRILFDGALSRDRLAERLESAWAVVVPSRFESFCLAAHEARHLGLPVLVPDLPAFADIFDERSGALVFTATVSGLRSALEAIVTDHDLRHRLAAAPPPTLGDTLAPYAAALPPPRHPQAQAGLATAAVQEIEMAMPAPAPSRLGPVARALMRRLPEPVARLAVKALPQGMKDRFRLVASWPDEEARRRREERLRRVEASIAEGRFPEIAAPVVSVIIPVYDDARYLMDALVSVFDGDDSEGRPSFEVIVVDDGSSDPGAIATIDGLDWPRVQVLRQENRGLPGARNAGIRKARGRYVVPLDSDDMLGPGYLSTLASALDDHPDAAFAHCWAVLFGDVDRLWQTRPYNPYQLMLSNSVVGCVMLRRSMLEAVGGYDESMTAGNEDWELWIRLMAAGYSQVQIPAAHFHYRKHGMSMSVRTEARFEDGRADIVRRHPRLYALDAAKAFKWIHYPLVSVIVRPGVDVGQGLDDLQVVPMDRTLAQAVEHCRGKYVVQWLDVEASPDALATMAAALEREPTMMAARPVDAPGPLLIRRWALHDSAFPLVGVLDVDVEAKGSPGELVAGMAPDPLWSALESETEVQRQRPEEDGYLPDWLLAP